MPLAPRPPHFLHLGDEDLRTRTLGMAGEPPIARRPRPCRQQRLGDPVPGRQFVGLMSSTRPALLYFIRCATSGRRSTTTTRPHGT